MHENMSEHEKLLALDNFVPTPFTHDKLAEPSANTSASTAGASATFASATLSLDDAVSSTDEPPSLLSYVFLFDCVPWCKFYLTSSRW